MDKLTKKSLNPFKEWEKPTFQDVVNIFEKLNLSDEKFTASFNINERTVRRWTSKSTVNRLDKSSIPYGVWCLLIVLSENKYIFSTVEKRDLSKIPKNYICTVENFISPPKEILTLFVGKTSITGLQRTELALLFGWNPTYLGREFNKGNISFLNWTLILLLCGVDIKSLIKLN